MAKFKVGDAIEWPWGAGHVEGHIVQVIEKSITKTIKGKKITRHGTPEKPAYLIKSSKGVSVLKLESEIHRQTGYAEYKAATTTKADAVSAKLRAGSTAAGARAAKVSSRKSK